MYRKSWGATAKNQILMLIHADFRGINIERNDVVYATGGIAGATAAAST